MRITASNAANFRPRPICATTLSGRDAAGQVAGSLPALWYEKMVGTTWAAAVIAQQKTDSTLYTLQKKKWDGWMGGNECRVEQRQGSYTQTKVRCTALSLYDRVAPRNMLHAFVSRRSTITTIK